MKKLAIVRGKFLNAFDMQSYEPLMDRYDMTAYGSLTPFHDQFSFPVVKLPSPMDIPSFPYRMPVLNRLFIDAHHLFGLERKLMGADIVDTAETYFYFSKQAMIAKQRGWIEKVVVRVYENIPFNNEGIWGRKGLKRFVRDNADHFIAISRLTKDSLVTEGADPKKISVIGHGIETGRFVPEKGHWQRLGRNMVKPLNILFVGRLEKEKGVYELLDAFKQVLRENSKQDIHMTYVGQGSEEVHMKRKIQDLGLTSKISFKISSYRDMPRIYTDADIVAFPSKRTKTWMEQYGIALLEAQSMGLPIVTTRSGAIPENVGTCALYATEGDSRSLAHHILAFIHSASMRVTYGRMARNSAEHVHDIHIIADKLDKVYSSL